MANRKRNIQMKFYVTEEEKRLIDEKMAQLPTRRYGAYLRKMAIDGYIIQLDTTDIKRMNAALSAIGRNINQIAKRINIGGGAYKADMQEIQERLDEIWPLTISATRRKRTGSCLFLPTAAPPKLQISNLPGPAATPSTRERTWAVA